MNKKDFYNTIEQPAVAEFKDRGSRFIAYAYPVSSAHDFKKHLKVLNCKAIQLFCFETETQLFCLLEIGIPKHRLEEVLYKIKDLRFVEIMSC